VRSRMKWRRVLAHLVDQRRPTPLGKRLTMFRIPSELPTARGGSREEEGARRRARGEGDQSAQVHFVIHAHESGSPRHAHESGSTRLTRLGRGQRSRLWRGLDMPSARTGWGGCHFRERQSRGGRRETGWNDQQRMIHYVDEAGRFAVEEDARVTTARLSR
jgi:hypothetical protein